MKILAVAFLAFSCGRPPSFVTERFHVNVYDAPMDAKQFKEEEDFLASILSQKARDGLSGLDFYFHSQEWISTQRGADVAAFTPTPLSRGESYVANRDCLAATAYLHELFHHVKYRVDKDDSADLNHADSRWNYIDNNVLKCEVYFKKGRILQWSDK